MTGYAFLESPGIPDDYRDNDLDGLTDERRDNRASGFISNPFSDPSLRDVQRDTAQSECSMAMAGNRIGMPTKLQLDALS